MAEVKTEEKVEKVEKQSTSKTLLKSENISLKKVKFYQDVKRVFVLITKENFAKQSKEQEISHFSLT